MATTASALLQISMQISEVWGSGPSRQTKVSDVLGPYTPLKIRMANGTTAGKIDRAYFNKPTIGAGATRSWDLAGGNVIDEEGNTLTFAKLKGFAVFNFDTDSTLTLKEPASAAVAGVFAGGSGGGIVVQAARAADDPGFVICHMPGGVTVTATTADIIELTNGDGSNAANCYVAFYGTSA